MFKFSHDHVKPKHGEIQTLYIDTNCYIDTDSFIIHVKTDYIYKDIAEDVETIFELQILN